MDRDLRYARRAWNALAILNLAEALHHGWHRQWAIAAAAMLWTVCCVALAIFTNVQQRTRDEMRVVEAALHGIREEIERAGK